jgi:hypothetical protein
MAGTGSDGRGWGAEDGNGAKQKAGMLKTETRKQKTEISAFSF